MTIDSIVPALIDWRGTPIVKQSTIIYPGRQSSSMWMVEATVLDVLVEDHYGTERIVLLVQPTKTGQFGTRSLKPTRLTALERVTVLPKCERRVTMAEVMEESARY